ncbi:general secretion pathway protein GspC [Yersinia mollaretii]|uniref:General secretion pathway protein GspC n=2 Tax=Yersinia mollaretii TaxID=33060 RepID=A0AA44CN65_YERMO|nr:general secretion pathway protein GspC [Yersinia mollaretii]CNJ23566.1 general secretion pathway protein C [Yersinia mollaretii]CQQ67998.1 general secretion pathway protein C [Yersinia mollaretii]
MSSLILMIRKIAHSFGLATYLNTMAIRVLAALLLVIMIMLRIEPDFIPFWHASAPENITAPVVMPNKKSDKKQAMTELKKLDLFSAGAVDAPKDIYRVGHLSWEDPLFSQAPPSHLAVRLVGILNSTTPENSIAIIEQNKRQHSYTQGEALPEKKAVVIKIFADRVILDQQGYYKSLLLN